MKDFLIALLLFIIILLAFILGMNYPVEWLIRNTDAQMESCTSDDLIDEIIEAIDENEEESTQEPKAESSETTTSNNIETSPIPGWSNPEIVKYNWYITAAYWLDRNEENIVIDIDFVQFGTCKEDMSDCPGWVAPIINENPKIRTFPIETNVVSILYTSDGWTNVPNPTDYAFSDVLSWASWVNPKRQRPSNGLAEITVKDWKVFQVVEHYRP